MTDLAETPYALSDRYTRDRGRVFLQGTQALARFPLEQLRVDRAAGLRTAVFASGYPGSPLAGFDKEAAAAAAVALQQGHEYRHQPGLNEELAASAVMGSQLAMEAGPRTGLDGVIGIWYGKAPGLDRACDAIRHGVFAGTSAHGGVVAIVGDDPGAKSSTLPSSSDATLVDLHLPIFYPGDVQEAIDLGRHAIALSRAAGLWTSLKIVAGVADGTGTVDLDPSRVRPVVPTMEWKGKTFVPHPSGRLLTPFTLDIEREFQEVRLELARRYGVLNDVNRITANPNDAWIGIVSCGYTYHELLEALRLLGLHDRAEIEAAGIRLLQLQMPVPLDAEIVHEFAHGLSEIFVVEEKNPTLEWMIKDALYGWNERPLVVGKRAEDGTRLIPSTGHTDADAIIGPLRQRLSRRIGEERLAPIAPATAPRSLIPLAVSRAPHFCSGCPHNWSTKVPDGAMYGAGIGCHGMTTLMSEDRVGELAGITQMGGEGTQWIGMAPFMDRPHLFQNLGDGTFFHSGSLAIRFAVAAGVNITYKLLYNGTVAMTGGQDPPGAKPVPDVARMLLLEGVKQVLVTTDNVDDYRGVDLPPGVEVWDRTRIVEAQVRLSEVKGVTVLIHEQGCAAELRRDRKRGLVTTPTQRVVINERICEGCGDCGDKSGCLSVQPHETPFGRKTRIDQTSCNFDYSCLNGDCPSFMTVETAPKRAPTARARTDSADVLPDPPRRVPDECTIRMPGIGGTGVVTVSQILGTAAMLDGRHVRGLDQTGLSQKAGPVVSDLRLFSGDALPSNKATHGGVDVVLAFDLLAAASDAQLSGSSPDRTVVVASIAETPTGSMVTHPDVAYPTLAALRARVDSVSRASENVWVDAAALATAEFGDTTAANVMLVGIAHQAGFVPIHAEAIEQAIVLNGVAVERNRAAFRAGRRWYAKGSGEPGSDHASGPGPDRVSDAATVPALGPRLRARVDALALGSAVEEAIVRRVADLTDYQSAAYAERYLTRVEQVAARERAVAPTSTALTRTVVEQLHRLMAYKDEYEVARLLLLPEARAAAEAVGGKGARITWQLHPPMLRALGMQKKLKLRAQTAPAFRVLAAGKRLRGTAADPFGRSAVRRLERSLVTEYLDVLDRLERRLTSANLDDAAAIAALPDHVRGYESLKERRAAEYRRTLTERMTAFETNP